MTLDLACLGIVLAAAAWGAVTGALVQVGRLLAAVAGWAGARWLAPELAPFLRERLPAFAAGPAASVLAFVGCGLAAAIVARVLLGTALRRLSGSGGDRGLGALLGGAKAALAVWVVLSAIALFGRRIELGPLRLDPAESDALAFAGEHSALAGAFRARGPTLPTGASERGRSRPTPGRTGAPSR